MQFNRPDAGPERDQWVARRSSGMPRLKQPLDRGNQEVTVAERRLQQAPRVQGLIGGIAAQIEDEVGHLAPGVHGAPFFNATRASQLFDGGRDRALVQQ